MTEALYRQGILLVPTRGRSQYIREYSSWRERFPSLDAYMDVWKEHPTAQPEVLCGSGDIVAIDVDEKNRPGIAAIFDEELRTSLPELYPLLYVERTASGGMHYFFKCPGVKSEDIAFAPQPQTLEEEFSGDPIKYRPIIEIKSAMRLCRVYPCEGITKLQGDILALPVVSDGDFQHMRYLASLLNERLEAVKDIAQQKSSVTVSGDRPGDDYSNNVETTEIVALLEKHGWRVVKGNAYRGRILLNRPGAKTRGVDADILNRVFCVWSSSAEGFTVGEGLSFFSLYARLEHRGDFVAAAKELKAKGWAKPITVQNGVTPVRGEVVVSEVASEEGELTLWDEIQEEIRKSWDDEDIAHTLTFRHQEGMKSEVFGIASPGMVVLVAGRHKSRKSAFVSAIISSNICGEERCGHRLEGDGVTIWIDSEQSRLWVRNARHRMMIMSGVDRAGFEKKVVYIPLSGFSGHKKRMEAVREVISRYNNITAVVVDGTKDLVGDINDLKECTAVVDELRATANRKSFILVCVAHINKGDANTNGHLGGLLEKICDVRLDARYDEDSGHTLMSCPFSRGERVPPYTFEAKRGNIPHILGYPKVEYNYGEYFPLKSVEGSMPTVEPDRPFSLPETTREDRLGVMETKLTDQELESLYGRG